MLSRLTSSIVLLLVANSVFFGGILFVNAQLVPSVLGPVYESTGVFVRLLIFAGILTIPADFMKSGALQLCGVSLGAPLNMMIGTAIMVVGGVLVDGLPVTPALVGATLMAMLSCAMVAHLLGQARREAAGEDAEPDSQIIPDAEKPLEVRDVN
ncbi:MAG: hypothetical protein Alpg2KO_31980 [Alphaproteobacteria bacterium]